MAEPSEIQSKSDKGKVILFEPEVINLRDIRPTHTKKTIKVRVCHPGSFDLDAAIGPLNAHGHLQRQRLAGLLMTCDTESEHVGSSNVEPQAIIGSRGKTTTWKK
nr:ACT domain-containing protein [Tanacetum cinerariifolium]